MILYRIQISIVFLYDTLLPEEILIADRDSWEYNSVGVNHLDIDCFRITTEE